MNQNYFQQYYVQTITLRWLNVYQTCLHIYQQENNPLTIINIANHQQNDPHLMQLAQQFPMIFPIKIINNINIICYPDEALPIDREKSVAHSHTTNNDWSCNNTMVSLFSTRTPRKPTIVRYDQYARFYYPGLSTLCQQYQCPDNCTMIKNQGQQYGHLAPTGVTFTPWETMIFVDLIRPWTCNVNGQELEWRQRPTY